MQWRKFMVVVYTFVILFFFYNIFTLVDKQHLSEIQRINRYNTEQLQELRSTITQLQERLLQTENDLGTARVTGIYRHKTKTNRAIESYSLYITTKDCGG
jgi:hypothetical protein